MKISPLGGSYGSLSTPQTDSPPPQDLRRIKMNTLRSPPEDELNQEGAPLNSSEPTNVDSEETKPLSPQFAALARQRRALQVKEREIQERERALSSQPTAPGVDIARLKSDPLSVLQEAGVTYDQLTEAILSNQDGSAAKFRALEDRIKATEEGFDKKLTEREQESKKQVLAQMQKDATLLASQGDTYEMVRETGSIPDVIKLIDRIYTEKGEVLDVEEALQLVEDELVKESLKIAQIKKVQSKLAPPPAPLQPQRQPMGMRTLTNRDTSRAVMSAKARAIAAFNGTLKK